MREKIKNRILCALFLAGTLAAAVSCVPASSSEPCRAYGMTAGTRIVGSSRLAERGVFVRGVRGGKKTNPRGEPHIGDVGFRDALEASLMRAGIYSPHGEYLLQATLNFETFSEFAGNFTARTEVVYVLRDMRNGKVVFERTIRGQGTVSASEARSASARLRVAKERAMKMNLEKFIADLDREFRRGERVAGTSGAVPPAASRGAKRGGERSRE